MLRHRNFRRRVDSLQTGDASKSRGAQYESCHPTKFRRKLEIEDLGWWESKSIDSMKKNNVDLEIKSFFSLLQWKIAPDNYDHGLFLNAIFSPSEGRAQTECVVLIYW